MMDLLSYFQTLVSVTINFYNPFKKLISLEINFQRNDVKHVKFNYIKQVL